MARTRAQFPGTALCYPVSDRPQVHLAACVSALVLGDYCLQVPFERAGEKKNKPTFLGYVLQL